MMQRLSRTDAGFLAAETPEWLLHVGALMVFDAEDAARLSVERLRRVVTERFARLGMFRRRVVEMPGRLDRPAWEDVPELDVDAHLRVATVDAAGDDRALGELVGKIFGRPLDRTHPLWELWRLDGLCDGSIALLLKIHHACTDGVNAAEFALVMFDVDRDAPLERAETERDGGNGRMTRLARFGESTWSVATTPLRAARVAVDIARATPRLGRFALTRERASSLLPFEAPPSPFNGTLTSRRDLAFCSLSRADIDTVRHAVGVSLNDVVLAVCSGSLRRYLAARDALPDRTLVAQLPMAIRREQRHIDPETVPGNILSAMGAALPVHLDGPLDRIHAVHASTQAARSLHRALGEDLLAHLVAVPPPLVLSALVRSYRLLGLEARLPPIFNAIVSNVPGPPVPLYCAGARLAHAFLLGPLIAGGGLNITVVSYADAIEIGTVTCPDTVDDAWELADAMQPALEELLGAVGRS
jgi:WS/DGAT/MGAT family acyltransferase